MTGTESLSVVAGKIVAILEPLSQEERSKVLKGALALLGEPLPPAFPQPLAPQGSPEEFIFNGRKLGPAAARFVKQFGLSREALEQSFHFGEGGVEIIAHVIPGSTKKEQTVNAYVLVGIKALLATDLPSFSDKEGIAFCKYVGCYDKNNHTTNRNSAGNRIAGARETGFTLPAPGLRAGAEIVKQIASSNA